MTDQEIIRAVAEKVMGWTYLPPRQENVGEWGVHDIFEAEWKTKDGHYVFYERDWNPLTNPDHWMLVVERMYELGWYVQINREPYIWYVDFANKKDVDYHKPMEYDSHKFVWSRSENLGHAICEASIKAMERG